MSSKKKRAAGKGRSGHAAVAFSMVQHDALPLILQHPSMCEQQTICSLLCTCKAMHAPVHTYCAGLVPVSAGARGKKELKHLTRWLKQHACLIQQLNLSLDYEGTQLVQAEAAVAAALQKAAVPGPMRSPLQIQAFAAYPASVCVDVLLNALPAATLTSMQLVFNEEIISSRRAASALAGLTALEVLSLEYCGDGITRGLSALTHLRDLCVRPITNLSKVTKQMPSQLKQLTFSPGSRNPKQHFHLGHVTGLTRLKDVDGFGRNGASYTVSEKDQLPPNLEVLDVQDVVSAQPLLAVQRLRKLVLRNSTTPAEQLLQIASLSSLTSVQLWYRCRWGETGDLIQAPEAAAAAWHALPLTALIIRCIEEDALSCSSDEAYRLSPASAQQISRLQGLTRLELRELDDVGASAAQLGAMVKPLIKLQQLRLSGVEMLQIEGSDDEGSGMEDEEAGLRELLGSLSGLSGLRSLGISNWSLTDMAYRLAGATQLTGLELEECRLQDKDVTALARKLTGLQRLVLNSNELSNAVLWVIGRRLQQLTHLEVQETGISDDAAQRLKQQLTQLKGLSPH